MKYCKNCSIKSKLIWIILSITIFSLVAGFSFVIINDIQMFKRDMLENTTLIANIVSDYSVPDLAFQYKRWSEETLNKLSLIPNIEYSYLYDADGKRFASYNKTPDLIKPPDITLFPTGFKDHNLYVIKDVVYHDEKMGTIYRWFVREDVPHG